MAKVCLSKYLAVLCLIWLVLQLPSEAAPFAMFPKAGRLVSPDGRYEIRDVERVGAAGEFVGTSRSLWVTDTVTGQSRKLCDYLGLAAVAWSMNDSILITQYVGKKASRALIFPQAGQADAFMLDSGTLIQLLEVEWRPSLRENDHLFVEAGTFESDNFHFRVWGYGKHDPNGFRWNCKYRLSDGPVSCAKAE